MPKYEITTPDGRYEITVPEGTSEQQAYQYLQQQQQQQPEPGVLPAAGRFVRGAGRALAGGLTDLSDLGHAIHFPLLRHGPQIPQAVRDFANAPTPSAAETAGWWGGEGLQALIPPGEILPLSAAARGVKAGGRYLFGKFAPKLRELAGESARQTATQTGKEVGEQVIKKPRLRIKASGEVKEVTPEGTERTVRNWTKRRMEKLQERASAQPPPTEADVHADYQKVVDALGEHAAHRLGRHLLHTAGVPPLVSHALMTRMGRRLGDLAITTGTLGAGRTLSGEAQDEQRRTRTPENNPPALPPYSGSPL